MAYLTLKTALFLIQATNMQRFLLNWNSFQAIYKPTYKLHSKLILHLSDRRNCPLIPLFISWDKRTARSKTPSAPYEEGKGNPNHLSSFRLSHEYLGHTISRSGLTVGLDPADLPTSLPFHFHQRGGLVVSLRGRYRTRRWEIRVRIPGRGNAR